MGATPRDVAKHIHPPSSPPRLALKMLGFVGVSKRFRIAYTVPGTGGRVVEGSGLENRRGFTPSVGSNPTLSASGLDFLRVSGRFYFGSHNYSHFVMGIGGDGDVIEAHADGAPAQQSERRARIFQ